MQQNKIYIIGIGGIGISAIARYYLTQSYVVYGSDKSSSEITENLKKEGINIIIGENPDLIDSSYEFIVYTQAVPENQSEIQKAKKLGLKVYTYPEALAEITKNKNLITIAGTHGKSTTSSIISLILKNSDKDFISIVGALLKEFDNKNFYYRNNNMNRQYFVLEACEYKRSFLNYSPTIGVITNIELDHLDYYKDLNDYISAFESYIDNIIPGGFAVINGEDSNCLKLIGKRKDINYIEVYNNYFRHNGQEYSFPVIDIKIPGEHILFDAKIAYTVGYVIGLNGQQILSTIEDYNGIRRRMEIIGKTIHNNILISDYGHHPTEISSTLKSIKEANIDKKILTVFQPHQYSRTYELLEGFINCFRHTDKLIVSNIYKSRDSKIDMEKINTQKLVEQINHIDKTNGENLDKTLKLINEFDENNSQSIIILLGAGDIDNLRYKIKTIY